MCVIDLVSKSLSECLTSLAQRQLMQMDFFLGTSSGIRAKERQLVKVECLDTDMLKGTYWLSVQCSPLCMKKTIRYARQ